MLHPLGFQDNEKILRLIAQEPPGFMVALGGLQAPTSRFYVDDGDDPRCALILSSTGWHAALGEFGAKESLEANRLLLSGEGLVAFDELGIKIARLVILCNGLHLEGEASGRWEGREMIVLQADHKVEFPVVREPRISDLDLESYDQAARFVPMLRRFWPEPKDLMEKRFAKAFVEDGLVKGVCYSCFISRNLHEPHIVVDEPDRGKGIGKLLAAAYSRALVARGCRIFWSYYSENVASGRCAEGIGFRPYGFVKVLQYVESVAERKD